MIAAIIAIEGVCTALLASCPDFYPLNEILFSFFGRPGVKRRDLPGLAGVSGALGRSPVCKAFSFDLVSPRLHRIAPSERNVAFAPLASLPDFYPLNETRSPSLEDPGLREETCLSSQVFLEL
ncbi:hypothetical protein THAR02_11275 [Trichoderma harzianum]|uniref:Uncharacterized protein n=1 Tax=Trichoderma harzianum TaxID=5544 RepID=A0A0F9WVX6_TRIHA|nr:hypothetical protein THAR02_11275 [Trichoderma harzianum]